MNRKHSIVLLLVAILMTAGSASAIRKGRLIGTVLDPLGNPIEGVTVTATSPEVPDFNVVETTDRKGVFKVDFDVINVVYQYRFDKAGYATLKAEQTWKKDGTARQKFTLYPSETPTMEGVAPAAAANPAIESFNAGVKAFEAMDYAAAVTAFEEAVGHDPGFHRAWGALSVALVEQHRYEDAAVAAEKALELGSTHEMVYRARWEAYRNLGDEAKTAQALEDLERSGQLAVEAKKVFNEAVRLSKQDDFEAAFAKYQEAARMDPTLQVALLGVGTTGLKIDRNEEALAAAMSILDEDPESEEAIRIRYNAALALGHEDQIIEALVGLAPVEPETARQGLWILAMAAYDADVMDEAARRFEKVLEVDPNRARAHYYLGLIYVSEQANEKATQHLQRFVELAPDDPEAATANELITFLGKS
jgi:tetratricopeptide (TPR) repeat protein